MFDEGLWDWFEEGFQGNIWGRVQGMFLRKGLEIYSERVQGKVWGVGQ